MMFDAERCFLFLKTTRTAGTNLEFALGPALSPGSIRTPIRTGSADYDRTHARTEWRPWREVRDTITRMDVEREILGRRLRHRGLDRSGIVKARLLLHDLLRGQGPLKLIGSPLVGRQHPHMTAAEARWSVGPGAFEAASKMAVVRHPYDHAVSMYFYSLATDPGFAGWGFDDWLGANAHLLTWNRAIITIGDQLVVDRLLRHEELPDALPSHLVELGIDPGPVVERFAANRLNGDTRPERGSTIDDLAGTASRRLIDEICWFEFDVLGYRRADGSTRRSENLVVSVNQAGFDRNAAMIAGLPLDRPGIEIAPLFRPLVDKARAEVFYVDVCSAEESRRKHADYEHDPIVDIDVVWHPGRQLVDCVPNGQRFAWGVASHVLEHVPDPIGWLNQVLAVMEEGAVLSLALPDKHHCFDRFRADTTPAELIDSWIRGQTIPSPRQVFDFTSRSVTDGYVGHDGDPLGSDRLEDCTRGYTDEQSFQYVLHTWRTGDYLDVHCSVFSVASISTVLRQLVALGVLAVEVSEPVRAGSEFHLRLTKTGEPEIRHPGPPHPQSLGMAQHHFSRIPVVGPASESPSVAPTTPATPTLSGDLGRALRLTRRAARRVVGRR